MKVFLSYQSRDLDVAQRISDLLRRERPDLEIFLAPRVLTAGAYWLPKLADALAASDAMLLLVGQQIGTWQELEYYEAQQLARRPDRQGRPLIVPIVTTDRAPGLPFLDLLHRVFAPDPSDPAAIAMVLAALAGATSPGAPPAWAQFNPYKGLPALKSADAAFFFGRDALTGEVLDALGRHRDRVIMLVGASGVGKSSVAQAGVLAALRSQLWPGSTAREWPTALADSRRWLEVTIRPGDAPLKELAIALIRLIVDRSYEQDRDADGWVRRFEDGATLADLLRVVRAELELRTGGDAPHFVLYVDQGEELYSRAAPLQARRFTALLAEAARQPDVHVLASIRSDYYGQLQADTVLFAATLRLDVPPLAADALEEVIRGPAERLGATFDSLEMPSRIAAAAAQESGALPLLSFLLSDMWREMQARADGVLRWLDRPELIDIAAPLRDRAERYLSAHAAQAGALRRLFTLRLAHVPREGEAVRRRARRGECPADEWREAETLAGPDWRLLTLSAPEDDGEPTAEVAHEQLLRKWPTLKRWLDDEREFLVWRGEIEADRREWERLPPGERASGLLSGRRLLRARHWVRVRPDDIGEADRAFIGESDRVEIEARNQDLLDQQRLKEAELQAALQREAAARQREAAARQIARRTVLGAIGVVTAGAAAGVMGVRAVEADRRRLRQLDDLKAFWAREESERDSAAVPASSEETVQVEGVSAGAEPGNPSPTWGITAVGADASRYTGKGCVVALLGTGIDIAHPAFRGITVVRKDFTGKGHGDRHGHSTHTAGTIFGRVFEGRRFGVALGITEVLDAKVLGDEGVGTDSAIMAGLRWALSHPRRPDVVCVPLGALPALLYIAATPGQPSGSGPEVSQDLAWGLHEYLEELRAYRRISVLAALVDKGAVLVMPAGNDSDRDARLPVTSSISAIEGVLSIGAVERADGGYRVAYYSNAMPTLCAPGSDVQSATVNRRATSMSGTSMACAHAAGVAALWWERLREEHGHDEVTSRMVVEAIVKSARADVFAPDVQANERGAGLIQAPGA